MKTLEIIMILTSTLKNQIFSFPFSITVEALTSGPNGEILCVRVECKVNMPAIISGTYKKDNTFFKSVIQSQCAPVFWDKEQADLDKKSAWKRCHLHPP
jgi:hypothetical protein